MAPNSACDNITDTIGGVLLSDDDEKSVAILAQTPSGNFVEEKKSMVEAKKSTREGYFSMRLMAIVGGISLVLVATAKMLIKLLDFHILGALVEFYVILLGMVVLLLEGKAQIKYLPQKLNLDLQKYALFLSFLWGRGVLYFVAGSLLLSQLVGLADLVVGVFMCFVGILYCVVGHQTSKKLKETHRNLYTDRYLRQCFDEADSEGTGYLSSTQFTSLIHSLGLDLTRRETEAIFIIIDQNGSGSIAFDDFNEWWSDCDAVNY